MSGHLPEFPEEPAAARDTLLDSLDRDEREVYLRIDSQVAHVSDPSFETAQAEDALFGDVDVVPSNPPTRKEEVWLFRRVNYARYRLALLIEAQARRQSLTRARQMVRWQLRLEQSQQAMANVETLAHLGPDALDLYAKIPETVTYIANPLFETAQAEAQLFGEDTALPEYLERLTPPQEIQAFLAYNYARYRLSLLLESQDRRLSATRAHEMVAWFRRVLQARERIVVANMALVTAMASRKHVVGVEFGEMVAEGNVILLNCVDNFDIARGFRFSTYACRAILRHFCQMASQSARYYHHFPVSYEPDFERSDHDETRHEWDEEFALEAVHEILRDNKAGLSDQQAFILQRRFGLDGDEGRHTLAEIGEMLDLTDERIRQLQWEAIGKIRHVLEHDYLQASEPVEAP